MRRHWQWDSTAHYDAVALPQLTVVQRVRQRELGFRLPRLTDHKGLPRSLCVWVSAVWCAVHCDVTLLSSLTHCSALRRAAPSLSSLSLIPSSTETPPPLPRPALSALVSLPPPPPPPPSSLSFPSRTSPQPLLRPRRRGGGRSRGGGA